MSLTLMVAFRRIAAWIGCTSWLAAMLVATLACGEKRSADSAPMEIGLGQSRASVPAPAPAPAAPPPPMAPAESVAVSPQPPAQPASRKIIRNANQTLEVAQIEPALDAIRAKAPDLVCLDVMMEGLDGISVAAQLRAEEMTTKIVLVTGYASAEVIARARELGVAGVVVKPFSAARVLGTIHAALAEAPAAEVTSA